jgi:hypothetical protein
MTGLAHDCAMLGIPVAPERLYDGDDPYYELWLSQVLDRVLDSKRQQAEAERRAAKTK